MYEILIDLEFYQEFQVNKIYKKKMYLRNNNLKKVDKFRTFFCGSHNVQVLI